MRECGAEGLYKRLCLGTEGCFARNFFLVNESTVKIGDKNTAIAVARRHRQEAGGSNLKGCREITAVIKGIEDELTKNEARTS